MCARRAALRCEITFPGFPLAKADVLFGYRSAEARPCWTEADGVPATRFAVGEAFHASDEGDGIRCHGNGIATCSRVVQEARRDVDISVFEVEAPNGAQLLAAPPTTCAHLRGYFRRLNTIARRHAGDEHVRLLGCDVFFPKRGKGLRVYGWDTGTMLDKRFPAAALRHSVPFQSTRPLLNWGDAARVKRKVTRDAWGAGEDTSVFWSKKAGRLAMVLRGAACVFGVALPRKPSVRFSDDGTAIAVVHDGERTLFLRYGKYVELPGDSATPGRSEGGGERCMELLAHALPPSFDRLAEYAVLDYLRSGDTPSEAEDFGGCEYK